LKTCAVSSWSTVKRAEARAPVSLRPRNFASFR
jgi:hypothetical protein